VDLEEYSVHPLSFYWDGGEPRWLRVLLGLIVGLACERSRALLRHTVFRSADGDLMVQAPTAIAAVQVQEASVQA